MSDWETSTPIEIPLLQYTTAALGHRSGIPPTPFESPISNCTASLPSIGNSPNNPVLSSDVGSALLQRIRLVYGGRYPPSHIPLQNVVCVGNNCDDEEMAEEDPDDYCWDPSSWKCSPIPTSMSIPTHRRSKSTNEVSLRNARKAHTVVERSMAYLLHRHPFRISTQNTSPLTLPILPSI
jgi:hypothetical protein